MKRKPVLIIILIVIFIAILVLIIRTNFLSKDLGANHIAPLEKESKIDFEGGEWEVVRTVLNEEPQTGKTCINAQDLREFYSKDYFLRDLESQCDTKLAIGDGGYEIIGECRNKTARYTTMVKHQKISPTHFTLKIEVKNKDHEVSYAETLDAKRLGACN